MPILDPLSLLVRPRARGVGDVQTQAYPRTRGYAGGWSVVHRMRSMIPRGYRCDPDDPLSCQNNPEERKCTLHGACVCGANTQAIGEPCTNCPNSCGPPTPGCAVSCGAPDAQGQRACVGTPIKGPCDPPGCGWHRVEGGKWSYVGDKCDVFPEYCKKSAGGGQVAVWPNPAGGKPCTFNQFQQQYFPCCTKDEA